MKPVFEQKRLYTIQEACWTLAVGATKLYELIKEGHLQSLKVGRRTLITADSIDKWLLSFSENRAQKCEH